MLGPILGWITLILVSAGAYAAGAALLDPSLLQAEGQWSGLFIAASLFRGFIAALSWPLWVLAGRALRAPQPTSDASAGAVLGLAVAFVSSDQSLHSLAENWRTSLASVIAFALGGLAYAALARRSPARASRG